MRKAFVRLLAVVCTFALLVSSASADRLGFEADPQPIDNVCFCNCKSLNCLYNGVRRLPVPADGDCSVYVGQGCAVAGELGTYSQCIKGPDVAVAEL